MTQAEAKMRILAEWRTWVGHREIQIPIPAQSHRCSSERSSKITPDLLSFESSDDKRQLVKRWLGDAGLIKG
jgi:hypothetical protein